MLVLWWLFAHFPFHPFFLLLPRLFSETIPFVCRGCTRKRAETNITASNGHLCKLKVERGNWLKAEDSSASKRTLWIRERLVGYCPTSNWAWLGCPPQLTCSCQWRKKCTLCMSSMNEKCREDAVLHVNKEASLWGEDQGDIRQGDGSYEISTMPQNIACELFC